MLTETEQLQEQINDLKNQIIDIKKQMIQPIGDKLRFEPVKTQVFKIDAKEYFAIGLAGITGTFVDNNLNVVTVTKGIITALS